MGARRRIKPQPFEGCGSCFLVGRYKVGIFI
nr:MAG TPA: protein of unknown function (DUF4193) [Caudoviricetes sp.]